MRREKPEIIDIEEIQVYASADEKEPEQSGLEPAGAISKDVLPITP